MDDQVDEKWNTYIHSFNKECRTKIFSEMILTDVREMGQEHAELSLLDIGCGNGFDCDALFQSTIGQTATKYIGVEPDEEITPSDAFTTVHRCTFDEASIEPDTINIAFAVMVLEHIENPKLFWEKVHRVLRVGGVFWGFTIDSRHWFAYASLLAELLHIKKIYLDRLLGKHGELRYQNYGAFYKCNTPQQIRKMTESFSDRTIMSLNGVGQLDSYIPRKLRWIGRALDRHAIKKGWPGSTLAVRVVK